MNCYTNQSCGYQMRSFLTREEKLEMLKEYKEALDQESKGVSERISQLQNEDQNEN